MPIFSILLDTFQITDTRSAHTDTDYVSVTLSIAGVATTVYKAMNNLNNGRFNVGVGFPQANIPFGSPVVINYMILNSSLKASIVEPGLQTLGNRVATVAAGSFPPLTSALQQISSEFAQEIGTITNHPSCDGLVAAEQNSLTYDQLVSYASQSPYFSETTHHLGSKAPGGCNSKPSAYAVTWTIQMQSITVPDVTLKALGKTTTPGTALYILAQNSLNGQVKTGPTGITAEVYLQNPVGGTPTYAGNTVELTTRLAQ